MSISAHLSIGSHFPGMITVGELVEKYISDNINAIEDVLTSPVPKANFVWFNTPVHQSAFDALRSGFWSETVDQMGARLEISPIKLQFVKESTVVDGVDVIYGFSIATHYSVVNPAAKKGVSTSASKVHYRNLVTNNPNRPTVDDVARYCDSKRTAVQRLDAERTAYDLATRKPKKAATSTGLAFTPTATAKAPVARAVDRDTIKLLVNDGKLTLEEAAGYGCFFSTKTIYE